MNCTDEMRCYTEDFVYMNVQFKHRVTQETGESFLEQLPKVINCIDSASRGGKEKMNDDGVNKEKGGVLVYCNNGKNRLASVVNTYLMSKGIADDGGGSSSSRCSASKAYSHVRKIRVLVETSLADQLLEFENQLSFGTRSE